jgi:hypothetical protein
MQHNENIVEDEKMDLQEFNLLKKFDDAYQQILQDEVREEVQEEVDEFGIEGNTLGTQTNQLSQEQVKVRRRVYNKNDRYSHGLSMIAILFEIVTVALLVLMFLSLDI